MKKNYLLFLFFFFAGLGNGYSQIVDLHTFAGPDGARGGFDSLLLIGKTIYGTTQTQGEYGYGNIYAMDTDGTNYRVLFSFSDTNGAVPDGSLKLMGDKFYGTTHSGGLYGFGVIFSMDTDGSNYSVMHSFDNTDGSTAYGSLTLFGEKFYGMTGFGGTSPQDGILFSIDSSGANYKVLHGFVSGTGYVSPGDVIVINNILYGMTEYGGTYNAGVIFSVDTDGTNYLVIHTFTDTDGAKPNGSLKLIGSKVYGLTQFGGASNDGVIFSMDVSGNNYIVLHSFNDTDGRQPLASLLFYRNKLFGTTVFGGTDNDGVVFSVDTSGTNYMVIGTFNGTNGYQPFGSLTEITNGLVGTTFAGGANSLGVIFVLHFLNVSISPLVNISCNGGNDGVIFATPSGGENPYTYSWSPANGTAFTLTGLSAGTYTVTITDNNGQSATSSIILTQPSPIRVIRDSIPQTASCNGLAALLPSGGTPPYTYQWLPGGQTTDTISNQCAGTYCCNITDNNNCLFTTCITIDELTGMGNVDNSEGLEIFPNPSQGKFVIRLPSVTKVLSVNLYDIFGRPVFSQRWAQNNLQYSVDLNGLSDGIYLCRVIDDEGKLIGEEKLLLQK